MLDTRKYLCVLDNQRMGTRCRTWNNWTPSLCEVFVIEGTGRTGCWVTRVECDVRVMAEAAPPPIGQRGVGSWLQAAKYGKRSWAEPCVCEWVTILPPQLVSPSRRNQYREKKYISDLFTHYGSILRKRKKNIWMKIIHRKKQDACFIYIKCCL